MKNRLLIILILFGLISVQFLFGATSLRIVSYNLLNYDGMIKSKNNNFRTVISSLDPDIIVVQEIETQTAVDSFAISVLENRLATITFHYTQQGIYNHFFYNPFEIQFLSADYIETSLRDIAEYKIRIPSTNDTVFIYSAHLKASQGSNEEQQRLAEVTILRNRLNTYPEGTKFILCGDLNIYKATEPAYQKLISEEQGNFGQLFDPIDREGTWHNNASYEDIHTQSTRATDHPYDGGSPGGMDDRFDFILISEEMLSHIDAGTYDAYGNDGDHFNDAINSGTNGVVSSTMANALYYASDHLPVTAVLEFGVNSIENLNSLTPAAFQLDQNYPNPFNPSTMINYQLPITNYIDLSVYNLLGQKVMTLVSEQQRAGYHQIEWNASGFASGIYYYQLRTSEGFVQTKRLVLLR